MPTCIYSKSEFREASAEHILQNFLGARWKSAEIVCDNVQVQFGHTIDVALERALQPIRVILGTRGGRGGEGPTLKGLASTTGDQFDLEPGAKPRLTRPVLRAKQVSPDRTEVKVAADPAHITWALAELRRRFPGVTFPTEEEVRRRAVRVAGDVPQIELPVSFGGRGYARALAKSCLNLVGVLPASPILGSAFDAAREFVLHDRGDTASLIRWLVGSDPLDIPQCGPFDQTIFLASHEGRVDGLVQFFGCVPHAVRLATEYQGDDFATAYIVDPLREADPPELRNPPFDRGVLPRFDEQAEAPEPDVWEAAGVRLSRALAEWQDRTSQSSADSE